MRVRAFLLLVIIVLTKASGLKPERLYFLGELQSQSQQYAANYPT